MADLNDIDILNLQGLKVVQLQQDETSYGITVKTTYTPDVCPHCLLMFPPVQKHGTKRQVFMDMPSHGKRVMLLMKRQRYLCKGCNTTFDVSFLLRLLQCGGRAKEI